MCRWSWNMGASTPRNPQGLSRPVMGLLCPFARILKESRLDGVLQFLSYTITKYNSFSAESISALNKQVWEESFIYNYSALCDIRAFQTIHNFHFPFVCPSALSFLQLCKAIYNLIYKDGTSQVLFISCHFITIQSLSYAFTPFSLPQSYCFSLHSEISFLAPQSSRLITLFPYITLRNPKLPTH